MLCATMPVTRCSSCKAVEQERKKLKSFSPLMHWRNKVRPRCLWLSSILKHAHKGYRRQARHRFLSNRCAVSCHQRHCQVGGRLLAPTASVVQPSCALLFWLFVTDMRRPKWIDEGGKEPSTDRSNIQGSTTGRRIGQASKQATRANPTTRPATSTRPICLRSPSCAYITFTFYNIAKQGTAWCPSDSAFPSSTISSGWV